MEIKPKFKAWLINSHESTRTQLVELTPDDLPLGEVTVKVEYSTINYKDAAAISGSGQIIRIDKCVPGIDFAGTVISCANGAFQPGDAVIGGGQQIGEARYGGLAEYVRAPVAALVPMPAGMDSAQAMKFGTAGLTAGLSMEWLEATGKLHKPADILVTSVGGGVGGFSAALVGSFGHNLHAVTRPAKHDYAMSFGAKSVIDRATFSADNKALSEARWDAGIDTAGGPVLAALLSQLKSNAVATCCGITAGAALNTTVMPFILRGVCLQGINSAEVPAQRRSEVWAMLLKHTSVLEQVGIQEIPIEEVARGANDLIQGKILGRLLVKIAA